MPYREPEILKQAAAELNRSIAEQFALQGHTLTGAAERSLSFKLSAQPNNVTVEGTAVEYMADLNEYTPPEHIEYSAEQIRELEGYVQKRMGISGKQATKIAILILKKHKKEGRPTEASSQYSANGERIGFIEDANADPGNRTDDIISDGIDDMMENYFSKQKSETV